MGSARSPSAAQNRQRSRTCGPLSWYASFGSRTAGRGLRVNLASDHQTVSIHSAETKLSHSPRLIAERFRDLRSLRTRSLVVVVNAIYDEIAEAGVVADVASGEGVGAFTGHDAAPVFHEHPPA